MRGSVRLSLILTAFLCFILVGTLFAQTASLHIRSVSPEEFPLMRVTFDARDKNGVPIRDLAADQLTVQEDGQPQEVISVTTRVDEEVVTSLALVIDVSGSTEGQPLENARLATNNLLDSLDSNDRAAIITVRPEVSVDPTQLEENQEVGFTTDRNAIRNVVDFLEIQGEDTALYDAMLKAVRLTAAENVPNRAIIVMSDGRDLNRSLIATADDPINEANRNRIPIFTIGMGQPRDEAYLQRVAVRTGGTFQATNDPAELAQLFAQIQPLLKEEFVLFYTSALPAIEPGSHILSLAGQIAGQAVSTDFPFSLVSEMESGMVTDSITSTTGLSATVAAEATLTANVEATSAVTSTTSAGTNSGLRGILDSIRDNPVPVIGGAGLLLLVIIGLIIFMLIKGRREQEEEDLGWSTHPPSGNFGSFDEPSGFGPKTQDQTVLANEIPFGQESHSSGIASYSGGQTTIEEGQPGAKTQEVGRRGITALPTEESAPFVPSRNNPNQAPPRAGSSSPKKTIFISRDEESTATPYLLRNSDQTRFELNGERLFVGRNATNAIQVDHATVSDRHAVIIQRDNTYYIQDVGSTNGTFLNGERVTGRQTLSDGDAVRIGRVEMTFMLK